MVAPLGVGSAQNATTATLDASGFLTYAHGGPAAKVLDVAHWKYELGNDLNFVGHINTRSETFKLPRARSSTVFARTRHGSMKQLLSTGNAAVPLSELSPSGLAAGARRPLRKSRCQ